MRALPVPVDNLAQNASKSRSIASVRDLYAVISSPKRYHPGDTLHAFLLRHSDSTGAARAIPIVR